MKEFTFHVPTEIVFGKKTQEKVAGLIQKYGGSRILVVYGGGSVVKSGLLKQITDQLEENGIAYKVHGGVKPNPIASHVREGIKTAVDFGVDFILAVGGGSVIDESKAIAHGTKTPEIDFWSYWEGTAQLTETLPVGVVLTISAAGSETSMSAVITNDEIKVKRGLSVDLNRPRFAVMNPELTFSLPKYQIACGVVDIMMHTLERYFTNTDGNQITDEIAESVLRVVIKNGSIAIENPTDYDAMSEIMWCGSLSHNGLTGLGRPMDFSVHKMGHELGGRFDVTHGASLSALWGSWAEYCMEEDVERFARYAKKVWDIELDDTRAAAVAGIEATVKYFKGLDMPTNLSELKIGELSESLFEELADRCVFQGTVKVGSLKPLEKNDVVKIFKLANRR